MRIYRVIRVVLFGLFLGAGLSGISQAATEKTRTHALTCVELMQNGGFESGSVGWHQSSLQGHELISDDNPRSGDLGAYLGGDNDADDTLGQTIALPAGVDLTLKAWWSLATGETAGIFDTLTISLVNSGGTTLATLATLNNTAETGIWDELVFDLKPYAGQAVTIRFVARSDQDNISDFYLDDISLLACTTPAPLDARVYLPLILK